MFNDAISRAAAVAYLRKYMGQAIREMASQGLEVGASHMAADLNLAVSLLETMPAMEQAQ
jgi:hypothetical protein